MWGVGIDKDGGWIMDWFAAIAIRDRIVARNIIFVSILHFHVIVFAGLFGLLEFGTRRLLQNVLELHGRVWQWILLH